MQPAGPEKAIGIISAGFVKDPTDPQWQDTPEYREWLDWMKKYNSSANVADVLAVWGYSMAQTMTTVLKMCDNGLILLCQKNFVAMCTVCCKSRDTARAA